LFVDVSNAQSVEDDKTKTKMMCMEGFIKMTLEESCKNKLKIIQEYSDKSCSFAFIKHGNMYNFGKCTKVSYKRAIEFYEKAGELGDASAFFLSCAAL
jgi:TPR repeat protein